MTVILDYGHYPFIRSTVRDLIAAGHDFAYLYSASVQSPNVRTAAPASERFRPIRLPGQFRKDSLFARRAQEIEWAQLCLVELARLQPAQVVSANAPLEVQARVQAFCRRRGIRFIYWLQDIHGLAMRAVLPRRLPVAGHLISRYYEQREIAMLRHSDRILAISEEFRDWAIGRGVDGARVQVLPNWAPLADYPERPQRNAWSEAHGLAGSFNFIYTGTLALKHNPRLLLELARAFALEPRVRVVVISEGRCADELRTERLENLRVLPFQDHSVMPDVLASASVLAGVLEPDAARFSVPSKVLSYLCAGRAQLLAVPSGNPASRLILERGCGEVADPRDPKQFLDAARRLFAGEHDLLPRYAAISRRAAEELFDPRQVAARLVKALL